MKKWMKTAAAVLFGAVLCGAGAALSGAASVSAQAASYGIIIDGVEVTDQNKSDILGRGVFSYDPATDTLDVHGVYNSTYACIAVYKPDVTIYVSAESILSSPDYYSVIQLNQSATITGPGKLTLHQTGTTINSGSCVHMGNRSGELTLRNAEVYADSADGTALFASTYENSEPKLTLINSDLTAEVLETTMAHRAMEGFIGGVTWEGCSLTTPTEYADRIAQGYCSDTAGQGLRKVVFKADPYALTIAGKQVTTRNCADVLGDGVFSYDNNSKTLTVNGDAYSASYNVINNDGIKGLTVYVARDSVLTQSGNRTALYLYADTVITGPGRLKLMALRDIGIYVVNCKLTIKDATVEANPNVGSKADYGITGDSGKSALVITNSTVIAAGSNGGICDFTGGLTLNGVSVRTPAGGTVRNGSIWDGSEVAEDVTVEPCGPEITTQPKTVTVSAGATVNFTVAAAGTGLSYRWQYATGSVWRNSSQPGCNSATIQVEATAARDGQKYRCIVTGPYGARTVSSAAVLKVKPAITGRPQNITAKVGETAKFTVTASGSNLTYQWQYNNGNGWRNSSLAGSDTATLRVPVVAYRDGQQYCCIVKSGSGASVTSTAATLTVKPAITVQPKSVTEAVGETAKFTVTATGSGLRYQWQYNNGSGWANSSQSGCRTATLRVPVTAARDGQKYRCIVTAANGLTVTSSAAVLSVKTAILTQPQNVTAAVGETAKFTVTASGTDLTYQWQYNNGSGWNNSTQSGCHTATLRVPVTAARDGQKYRCVIIGESDSLVSAAATLTVR